MLSKFSVKRPYTVVVGVVLIIILGVVSFGNMTLDLLPSMNLPYAIVMTTYTGASPEEVEEVVTKPVEQTMAAVSNIKTIQSISNENASTVILEFEQTTNMDSVTIEMRESLDQIQGFWPDAVSNPIIMKLNPDMMPVLIAAVSAGGNNAAETSKVIKEEVIPEVESVEGVASVAASGSIENTVEITVNEQKVTELNDDIKVELEKKINDAKSALDEAKAQVESGKTLKTEEGSSLDDTAKVADQVMDRIGKIEDIKDIGGLVSASDMMGTQTESNVIEFYAITKDHPSLDNGQLKKKIESVTKDIDGELTVNMSNMDMSALGSSGINIQIKGKDLDKLQKVANDVKGIVEKTKGTQNVLDGTEDNNEELRVVVDKTKATQHGLTVAQVYQQLYGKLAEAQTATTLATDTNDYDVYVLDDANESLSREDIRNLTITAEKQDGTSEDVKLADIATFEDACGLRAISRKDQSRFMSVTAEIKDGDNIGLVSSRVKKALKFYDAPEGYEIKMTGEDETINEAMIELFKMLALAIVFMYLIMVAQFQSLRSPFIVMFTVPLAFTGGLLALWMSGMAVSVIAMIGFVMLSGIIVNNGIVFIDYTNQLIAAGMEKEKALVEAGKTRLRPIIMTALTTILGLSTMAIGFGMGSDMVQPMAVVTIGGLIYGTILTLVVVPCIFDLFHKKEKARLREGIEEIETTLDQ